MSEDLTRWWQGRTPRERLLLGIGGPLAVLALLWLALLRPLESLLAEAAERHEGAVMQLAQIGAGADEYRRQARAAPVILPEPLDVLISRSSAEAGFPVASVSSDAPGRATFAIPAVRPQAFFAWLGQLEANGVEVDRLAATANADQTLRIEGTMKAKLQ